MTKFLTNALGGVSGSAIAIGNRYMFDLAGVRYVDSNKGAVIGFDGLDRNTPMVDIATAIADIGANDDYLIVCLSGHAEEISNVSLGRRVTIVGEGTDSNGAPNVKLTLPAGANDMFTAGSGHISFKGIHFLPPGNAAAPGSTTGHYLGSGFGQMFFDGCRVDMDKNNDVAGISIDIASSEWRFSNCIFNSAEATADASSIPESAIEVTASVSQIFMKNCIFDGGVVGFVDGYAFDAGSNTISGLKCVGIDLLRGAVFNAGTSSWGYIRVNKSSGGGRVVSA